MTTTPNELYDGWVSRMAQRFQDAFSEIEPEFNFDHGPEAEIAFCRVLRRLLPERYSVCRGFVVARDGSKAGDDLIIFDSFRFPTLRSLGDDLAKKEEVPVEAVIAYIEVKHTLQIAADDQSGQSLRKAIEQVSKVKALPRARVGTAIGMPGFASKPLTPAGFPEYRNPLYTAILARYVNGGANFDDVELVEELAKNTLVPDVLAGGSMLVVPAVRNAVGRPAVASFREASSEPMLIRDMQHALGTAVVHMLAAFEWIQLGPFPWPDVFLGAVSGKRAVLPTRQGG